MEKRVFLAILLSFVVLVVYQSYIAPPPPPPQPAVAGDVPVAPAATAATQPGAPPPAAEPPAAAAPTATPAVPAPAVLVGDELERDIVVETDTVRAVFSTAGGVLRSWRLKRYLDHEGQPLDLVPADLPRTYARPFTLATDDPDLARRLAGALFRPSVEALNLGGGAGTLSFEYRDDSGLAARKTFHLQPEGKAYLLAVDASVDVAGAARPVVLDLGPAVALGYSVNGSNEMPPRGILFRDDSVERMEPDDLAKQARYEGALRFAGVEDHYFLSAVLPGARAIRVDYAPVTLPIPGRAEGARAFVAYAVRLPEAGTLGFFLGPKAFDVLRDVDAKLPLAIDFGFFAALVVPLLQALKWINGYLGNYGWSIIALTILINLAIFPLRHKSMVSMRKMQALQPEVKAIQERYKKLKVTDPARQKMNQEMMALYKQKGVNPASGCLPMLLTLPVLFAFYQMLAGAIELRGAPFVGWIQDLSAQDPFYVTPLLMGATMVWQQRMMPTTADPIQQKMFMLMPVMFTIMFLWAPSGLVLYWLMSNVMAIGQQYVTNRIIGAPVPVRGARPDERGGRRGTGTPEGSKP